MYIELGLDAALREQYDEAVQNFRLAREAKEPFDVEAHYVFAKSLNKIASTEMALIQEAFAESTSAYKKDTTHKLNTSLYMWLTYKCYVKNEATSRDMRMRAAQFIVDHSVQEEYSAYEVTVMKIVEYLEGLPNPNDALVLQWIDYLNPHKISKKQFSYMREGKRVENASAFEKWYVTKSKKLFALQQYEACIAVIDELEQKMHRGFTTYHYNQDAWCQRRKAKALEQLGRIDEAEKVLWALLKKFQHSSIYYDVMCVQMQRGQSVQALASAAEGLLTKDGKYEHKVKIIKDCARLLYEAGMVQDSYAHYVLLQKVRARNDWRADPEVEEQILRLAAQDAGCRPYTNKELQQLWADWQMMQYEEVDGIVKTILPNGQAGFISDKAGSDYYFNIKNSKCSMAELPIEQHVRFRKKPSFDRAKNRDSMEAIAIIPV
ncbi:DUF7017 domain-containing protein [Solibacillus sp. FSL H8-0538]|uniref:DUF7017 domain-containing protein n=1 Tax=Solibacillus sp. FSL H8-0538 TaxID=2921400 RepID=UPI0030FCA7CF